MLELEVEVDAIGMRREGKGEWEPFREGDQPVQGGRSATKQDARGMRAGTAARQASERCGRKVNGFIRLLRGFIGEGSVTESKWRRMEMSQSAGGARTFSSSMPSQPASLTRSGRQGPDPPPASSSTTPHRSLALVPARAPSSCSPPKARQFGVYEPGRRNACMHCTAA